MTSKFIHEFIQQWGNDMKKLRKATREVLVKGGDLAFEEYYSASSLERLKGGYWKMPKKKKSRKKRR